MFRYRGEATEKKDPSSVGPAPMGVESKAGGANNRRNQRMLVFIGVAILACIVVAAAFSLGFIIGNQSSRMQTLANQNSRGQLQPDGMSQGPPRGGPQGIQGQQTAPQGQQGAPQDKQQTPQDQQQSAPR
jgi:cell division protein FtsN